MPHSLRVNASAAARRSAAQRAPGRRPIRSIGPDTDTAAITVPRPSRTGAETLATPGSRSAALWAHPRRRTSASVRSVNLAVGSTACWVAASAYASSALGARARGHRQLRTDGHGVAQPGRWFERNHAHPRQSLPAVQLDALAGDLAEPRQHRGPRGQQRIVDVRGQFGEGRPEPPAPIAVAGQQAVGLQARGQPVGGGPGEAGPLHQFGQPTRRLRDRVQYAHRFVEHADAAIISHREILASRNVRWRV